jgi:biopolymer transport protein ExbD
MKLSSKKKSGAAIELSMTSMIDVVFLLLIFFMTTTTFVQTERQLDPAIRVERASTNQVTTDLEPAVVEVVRSGDHFVFRVGTREMTDRSELTRVLKQFGNQSSGAFVRVADEAPFGMAASAIQACKEANFLPVSYVPLESTSAS